MSPNQQALQAANDACGTAYLKAAQLNAADHEAAYQATLAVLKSAKLKADKAANDFANEAMGNARYPLELLLRVATVSVETMKFVFLVA
jgi:hypothetical protein